VICDNYATHKSSAVRTWLGRPPLLPPTFHPNLRQLAQSRGTLVRRTDQPQAAPLHPLQLNELEADVTTWVQAWNEKPKPFVWTKTDEILANLANYRNRINQMTNDSGRYGDLVQSQGTGPKVTR
jgi:hypothetical protein